MTEQILHEAVSTEIAEPLGVITLGDARRRNPLSTSTMRPGCSVCAARTRPHTAAPDRSATFSPGSAIAPRVCTIRTAVEASVTKLLRRSSARWVAIGENVRSGAVPVAS